MNHADHVALIAGGIGGAGHRWLELGAGNGEFTLALADCLGAGEITAVDRDRWALAEMEVRVAASFREVRVLRLEADINDGLPVGPFDGVLAANSLHFIDDPAPVLAAIRVELGPDGRLVIVEYDTDRGNPYVPHPISLARLGALALPAGFTPPRFLHRVPSRFLGSIYAAELRPI